MAFFMAEPLFVKLFAVASKLRLHFNKKPSNHDWFYGVFCPGHPSLAAIFRHSVCKPRRLIHSINSDRSI
jgi:hypothetical protein